VVTVDTFSDNLVVVRDHFRQMRCVGLVCQEVRLRTPAQGLPEFSLFGGDRLPRPTRIAVQVSGTRNGPIMAPKHRQGGRGRQTTFGRRAEIPGARASFPYAFGVTSTGRYPHDVLASGWQRAGRPTSTDLVLEVGLVLEDATSGFCGAVLRWERGLVVLEDRHGKQRTFTLGAGFWYEGSPVVLKAPLRARSVPSRTASGSVVGLAGRAKTALASRIYVEGRHDAELVEKIWGDDLRHVGVVVEYLGGIDDLPGIVADFAPGEGRRLGVLVDHLVPGSKESGIADRVRSGAGRGHVLVLGHPYVDIWQAVKPARLGLAGWPEVPRTLEWKHGICAALGLPHRHQADLAAAWRMILDHVRSWDDLERPLLTVVEQLIDFVSEDHD
jgi:hypothetical protein